MLTILTSCQNFPDILGLKVNQSFTLDLDSESQEFPQHCDLDEHEL